jgi:hypothetical protein
MKIVWISLSILIIGGSIGIGVFGGMYNRIFNKQPSPADAPPSVSIDSPVEIAKQSQPSLNPASARSTKLQILLPLYIYPNWYDRDKYAWQPAIAAAKQVPIIAIINPNNGPDNAPPNTDYQQGIKDLRQAGIEIVGYVPTNYAQRDLRAVEADIDLYAKHFNIDGIFIDEAANHPRNLNYYLQIYRYIKSQSNAAAKPYLAIANPGTAVDKSYIDRPIADITTIFENYQKVWQNYQPPTYVKSPNSRNFAVLIHTAADLQTMERSLDRVAKYQFGYVYITNDSVDSADRNPWNTVPDYWQSQVNYIQKLNQRR